VNARELEPPGVGITIAQRRRQLGLSLQDVANLAGCVRSYLWQIERGKRAKPPGEALLARLETALKVEPGSLIKAARWESTPPEIRERLRRLEREAVEARGLPRSGVSREPGDRGVRRGGGLQIPLLGDVQTVVDGRGWSGSAAGQVSGLGTAAEFEYIRSPDIDDVDAFAARLIGEGMSPTYVPGDLVIFSPARTLTSGMDCWVMFDGQDRHDRTAFTRVYLEEPVGERDRTGQTVGGVARLQPLNGRYPPVVIGLERLVRVCPLAGLLRTIANG
jgi:repressor LexA